MFSNIVRQQNIDKIANGMESGCSNEDCEHLSFLKRIYDFFKPEENYADRTVVDIDEFRSEDEQITNIIYTRF